MAAPDQAHPVRGEEQRRVAALDVVRDASVDLAAIFGEVQSNVPSAASTRDLDFAAPAVALLGAMEDRLVTLACVELWTP